MAGMTQRPVPPPEYAHLLEPPPPRLILVYPFTEAYFRHDAALVEAVEALDVVHLFSGAGFGQRDHGFERVDGSRFDERLVEQVRFAAATALTAPLADVQLDVVQDDN